MGLDAGEPGLVWWDRMEPLEARLLRLLAGPCRNWTMDELKATLHASKTAIWRALTALEEVGCIVIAEEED